MAFFFGRNLFSGTAGFAAGVADLAAMVGAVPGLAAVAGLAADDERIVASEGRSTAGGGSNGSSFQRLPLNSCLLA